MLNGIVIKSIGSMHIVKKDDGGKVECKIKGTFRLKGIKSTNPLAVGDRVNFEQTNDGFGLITEIMERTNYIIRKATNLSKQTHIIAANVDHAWLMVSIIHPETYTEFIDRFLVTAEAHNIPASLIFNKIDIYKSKQTAELKLLIGLYENAGYKCYAISALNKKKTGTLCELFKDNINLLCGNSGVGKSTLINTLVPSLNQKTREISVSHDKGKHTTTFAEMLELDNGGFIIDTPGIKSFGLIDIPKEELSHYFPEIRKLLGKCRFKNCLHIHEPGCAVIEALNKEKIATSRYKNYLSIYNTDSDSSYRYKN